MRGKEEKKKRRRRRKKEELEDYVSPSLKTMYL